MQSPRTKPRPRSAPTLPEEIPVLDLGSYLAGEPGALQRLGAELRRAFEQIGFYFIVNHGVPQSLVDARVRRSRALPRPAARSQAGRQDRREPGRLLPRCGSTTRHSQINP